MWHGKGIVAVIIFDEFHQPLHGRSIVVVDSGSNKCGSGDISCIGVSCVVIVVGPDDGPTSRDPFR